MGLLELNDGLLFYGTILVIGINMLLYTICVTVKGIFWLIYDRGKKQKDTDDESGEKRATLDASIMNEGEKLARKSGSAKRITRDTLWLALLLVSGCLWVFSGLKYTGTLVTYPYYNQYNNNYYPYYHYYNDLYHYYGEGDYWEARQLCLGWRWCGMHTFGWIAFLGLVICRLPSHINKYQMYLWFMAWMLPALILTILAFYTWNTASLAADASGADMCFLPTGSSWWTLMHSLAVFYVIGGCFILGKYWTAEKGNMGPLVLIASCSAITVLLDLLTDGLLTTPTSILARQLVALSALMIFSAFSAVLWSIAFGLELKEMVLTVNSSPDQPIEPISPPFIRNDDDLERGLLRPAILKKQRAHLASPLIKYASPVPQNANDHHENTHQNNNTAAVASEDLKTDDADSSMLIKLEPEKTDAGYTTPPSAVLHTPVPMRPFINDPGGIAFSHPSYYTK